jgi:hypothetical protein
MNILIVIPGFGGSNDIIEIKKQIFNNNLKVIAKSLNNYNIDIEVFNYNCISYNLCLFNNADNIKIREHLGKGIIGQFLYNYITPNFVEKYDYVVLILDDVELNYDTDFNIIFKNYENYQYDIVGVPISLDSVYSHELMRVVNKASDYIRRTNMLELFMNVMNKNKYIEFYKKFLNNESTWLWGIDLSFYYNNFKCGLIDRYYAKHYYKGESHTQNLPSPWVELQNNKKKFRYIDRPLNISLDKLII